MQRTILLFLIAFVVGVGSISLILTRTANAPQKTGDQKATQIYQSDEYGFSFAIPKNMKVKEYAPESLAIGTSVGEESFDAVVNVRIYKAAREVGYSEYEQYVFESLKNTCAADGPTGTIYCDRVENRSDFTTSSGLSGEELYLHRVHEDFSNQTTDESASGPFYVFNMAANVPSAQFVILTIEPPVNQAVSDTTKARVESVANSLTLSKVTRTPEPRTVYALVSDVASENDQTVVRFDTVEWLTGQAAYEAAARETECEVANADECAPSLYNDFYISNAEKETTTMPVAPDPSVTLIENGTSSPSTIGTMDGVVEERGSLLVELTIVGDQVTTLAEVYLP